MYSLYLGQYILRLLASEGVKHVIYWNDVVSKTCAGKILRKFITNVFV